MTTEILSRFKIIRGTPPALPGEDLVRNSSDEWYIDTGVRIDYHGAVYLGKSMIEEIAHLLGYTTPEETARLKVERATLQEQVQRLSTLNVQLNEAIDALRFLRDLDSNGSSSDVGSVSNDPIPEQSSDEPSNTAPAGDGEVASGENGSSESSDDNSLGELRQSSPDSESVFRI